MDPDLYKLLVIQSVIHPVQLLIQLLDLNFREYLELDLENENEAEKKGDE